MQDESLLKNLGQPPGSQGPLSQEELLRLAEEEVSFATPAKEEPSILNLEQMAQEAVQDKAAEGPGEPVPVERPELKQTPGIFETGFNILGKLGKIGLGGVGQVIAGRPALPKIAEKLPGVAKEVGEEGLIKEFPKRMAKELFRLPFLIKELPGKIKEAGRIAGRAFTPGAVGKPVEKDETRDKFLLTLDGFSNSLTLDNFSPVPRKELADIYDRRGKPFYDYHRRSGIMGAELIPYIGVFKGAGKVAKIPYMARNIRSPFIRGLFKALFGGTIIGLAQKPQEGVEDTFENRLNQVPPTTLGFLIFETGAIPMEKIAEIANWKKRYGPIEKEYKPEEVRNVLRKRSIGMPLEKEEQVLIDILDENISDPNLRNEILISIVRGKDPRKIGPYLYPGVERIKPTMGEIFKPEPPLRERYRYLGMGPEREAMRREMAEWPMTKPPEVRGELSAPKAPPPPAPGGPPAEVEAWTKDFPPGMRMKPPVAAPTRITVEQEPVAGKTIITIPPPPAAPAAKPPIEIAPEKPQPLKARRPSAYEKGTYDQFLAYVRGYNGIIPDEHWTSQRLRGYGIPLPLIRSPQSKVGIGLKDLMVKMTDSHVEKAVEKVSVGPEAQYERDQEALYQAAAIGDPLMRNFVENNGFDTDSVLNDFSKGAFRVSPKTLGMAEEGLAERGREPSQREHLEKRIAAGDILAAYEYEPFGYGEGRPTEKPISGAADLVHRLMKAWGYKKADFAEEQIISDIIIQKASQARMTPDDYARTYFKEVKRGREDPSVTIKEIKDFIATQPQLTDPEKKFMKLADRYAQIEVELEKLGTKHIPGTLDYVVKEGGEWDLDNPIPIKIRGEVGSAEEGLLRKAVETDRRLGQLKKRFSPAERTAEGIPKEWRAGLHVIEGKPGGGLWSSIYAFDRADFDTLIHELTHSFIWQMKPHDLDVLSRYYRGLGIQGKEAPVKVGARDFINIYGEPLVKDITDYLLSGRKSGETLPMNVKKTMEDAAAFMRMARSLYGLLNPMETVKEKPVLDTFDRILGNLPPLYVEGAAATKKEKAGMPAPAYSLEDLRQAEEDYEITMEALKQRLVPQEALDDAAHRVKTIENYLDKYGKIEEAAKEKKPEVGPLFKPEEKPGAPSEEKPRKTLPEWADTIYPILRKVGVPRPWQERIFMAAVKNWPRADHPKESLEDYIRGYWLNAVRGLEKRKLPATAEPEEMLAVKKAAYDKKRGIERVSITEMEEVGREPTEEEAAAEPKGKIKEPEARLEEQAEEAVEKEAKIAFGERVAKNLQDIIDKKIYNPVDRRIIMLRLYGTTFRQIDEILGFKAQGGSASANRWKRNKLQDRTDEIKESPEYKEKVLDEGEKFFSQTLKIEESLIKKARGKWGELKKRYEKETTREIGIKKRMERKIGREFSLTRGLGKERWALGQYAVGRELAWNSVANADARYLFKLAKESGVPNEYMKDALDILAQETWTDLHTRTDLDPKLKNVLLNLKDHLNKISTMYMTYGDLGPKHWGDFAEGLGLDQLESKALRERVERDPFAAEPEVETIVKNRSKYLPGLFRAYLIKNWEPKQADMDAFLTEFANNNPQIKWTKEELQAFGDNLVTEKVRKAYQGIYWYGPYKLNLAHLKQPQDMTPAWRRMIQPIEDPSFLVARAVNETARGLEAARYFALLERYFPDEIADTIEQAAERKLHPVPFPDSPMYGRLRNKFVSKDIYDFIKYDISRDHAKILRKLDKYITNPWKQNVVILNWPAHMRQAMTNTILTWMSDCFLLNPMNWPYYRRALNAVRSSLNIVEMVENPKIRAAWKDYVERGITGVHFSGNEIPNFLDRYFSPDVHGFGQKMMQKWRHFKDQAGLLYSVGDMIPRIAADIKNREHFKMSPAESAEQVNASLPNYRMLPRIVDKLKPFIPFISWPANVAKIQVQQFELAFKELKSPNKGKKWHGVKRLIKLAALYALPFALQEGSKYMFKQYLEDRGFSDKEADEQLRLLGEKRSKWRKGGVYVYLPPIGGKLRMFDLTYIWPGLDLWKSMVLGKNVIEKLVSGDQDAGEALKSFLDAINIYSHPWLDFANIIINGHDPGFPEKKYGPLERVVAAAQKFWVPASAPIPSIKGLTEGKLREAPLTPDQWKRIYRSFHGTEEDLRKNYQDTWTEVAGFFSGIRLPQFNPHYELSQYMRDLNQKRERIQREATAIIQGGDKYSDKEKSDKREWLEKEMKKIAKDQGECNSLLNGISKMEKED